MEMSDYIVDVLNGEEPKDTESFLGYIHSYFGESIILDMHKQMCEKYGMPQLGTKRATYISKFAVFKLPVNDCGYRDNDLEGSIVDICKGTPYEIPIAKSKLLFINDTPVVVMEKVQPLLLSEIKSLLGEIPSFVSFVDMGQVGLTKKGDLVAFDYAEL